MTPNDEGPARLLGELPAAVLAAVTTVREAGGEAYVVGGAVRDALLVRLRPPRPHPPVRPVT